VAASGPEDGDSKALRNVGGGYGCYVILDLAFPPRCLHPSGGGDLHNGIKGTHCYETSPFCMSWVHRKGTVSAATQTTRAGISVPARIVVGLSHFSLGEMLGTVVRCLNVKLRSSVVVVVVVVRHWGPVQNCSGETSWLNCVICKADRAMTLTVTWMCARRGCHWFVKNR